jgi:hypothetical protein
MLSEVLGTFVLVLLIASIFAMAVSAPDPVAGL